MAIIFDSRWRSLDSSGNPISGATLTVYTAGTTTPAAIYRDALLTVPMSNPTTGSDKADSAGRFPQIFAQPNTLFDILEKDAGGSTIAAYLSVSSLGTVTGSLVLDFTTSRGQIRGTGGVTYFEFGDASGDDVGGTGVIGGWNGTQADLITVNAAIFNITGRIKENSFKIPGVVRQEAVAFTGVGFVVIPLTNDPVGVRLFDVDVLDLIFSTTATLTVTFSFDDGSTYAAAGYRWAISVSYASTNAPTGSGSDTAGHISDALGAVAAVPALLRMCVTTPNSGNNGTIAQGQLAGFSNGGSAFETTTFTVIGPASLSRASHMKLIVSAGTFAGVARVAPQRGFGET